MKRLNKFLYTLIVTVLIFFSSCSDDDPVISSCEQDIKGAVSGIVTLVFTNETMTGFQVRDAVVNGSFTGTSDADLTITNVDQDGTVHFEGTHKFYKSGNIVFTTSDKGQMKADGTVENHLTIVEGTSGSFTTRGNVNLQTAELALTYDGKACL